MWRWFLFVVVAEGLGVVTVSYGLRPQIVLNISFDADQIRIM